MVKQAFKHMSKNTDTAIHTAAFVKFFAYVIYASPVKRLKGIALAKIIVKGT